MRHHGDGQFPPFGICLQPPGQGLLPFQHNGMGAPSGDGGHLRMVRHTDDEHLPALPFRLLHDAVDAGHVRAGSVDNRAAPGLQGLVNRPPLSVGADDDGSTGRYLVGRLDQRHALLLQIVNDAAIVDDGAQHGTGSAAFGGLFRQLHRPPDAVAEPGGPGQLHPHRPA